MKYCVQDPDSKFAIRFSSNPYMYFEIFSDLNFNIFEDNNIEEVHKSFPF